MVPCDPRVLGVPIVPLAPLAPVSLGFPLVQKVVTIKSLCYARWLVLMMQAVAYLNPHLVIVTSTGCVLTYCCASLVP